MVVANPRYILNALCTVLFSLSVIYGASFLKVSVIVGSMTAFFSGTSLALPMLGYYLGSLTCGVVIGLKLFIRLFFYGNLPTQFLAYHIPGLFASASLAHGHWLLRCALPVLCMGLFVAHPVGAAAFAYSFYWLIPVALYVCKKNTLFYHALASTLVAHAVGSVIWLYADPMTPAVWLALIPVVAVERLCFAVGIASAISAVHKAAAAWRAYTQRPMTIHALSSRARC